MPTVPSRKSRFTTLAVLYVLILLSIAIGADRVAVVFTAVALPLGFYFGWITHRDH